MSDLICAHCGKRIRGRAERFRFARDDYGYGVEFPICGNCLPLLMEFLGEEEMGY